MAPLIQSSDAQMAHAIRLLSLDMIQMAQSGHPGLPLGMADAMTALWKDHFRCSASHPHWPNRDRFVLSAGHGCAALYALNYLLGYPELSLQELRHFRQYGSRTPGHPEHDPTIGIEATTGPLGQGLANAVGMAIAEKKQRHTFGSHVYDHRIYVLVGDGCLMEGISHEAADLAGHLGLDRLIVLFDDNQITIDGPKNLSCSEDTMKRFEAYGWDTWRVDGMKAEAVSQAISQAKLSLKPSLIACQTIIGYGSEKAGLAQVHGSPLSTQDYQKTRAFFGASEGCDPFWVDPSVLKTWRYLGERLNQEAEAWYRLHPEISPSLLKGQSIQAHTVTGELSHPQIEADLSQASTPQEKDTIAHQRVQKSKERDHQNALGTFSAALSNHPSLIACYTSFLSAPPQATRQWSQKVLQVLHSLFPSLLGGSADLSGSNGTLGSASIIWNQDNPTGNYLHYGVREHAMGAIMNGIALHDTGLIPFGGTFLCFLDYMRPAIRLAALMKQKVIFVATHDSIGLGEDGPTHQPIEHLASLRCMPHLEVWRPADGPETLVAWMEALHHDGPSVLCLSRQTVQDLKRDPAESWSSFWHTVRQGVYVLQEPQQTHGVDLWATGSEVGLAQKVAALLESQGLGVRILSAPCLSRCPTSLKQKSPDILSVSIEAASTYGWHTYVGDTGLSFGIDHFGASGSQGDLYSA